MVKSHDLKKIPELIIITKYGIFKYSGSDSKVEAKFQSFNQPVEVINMKIQAKKNESALCIYPLFEISENELEYKKSAIFYRSKDLMKQEGYILDNDLSAVHEDAQKPFFKNKFCKNGWEIRRITNIEGWIVIIRYQRYRTRQENKIRGSEMPIEFSVIAPRKQRFPEATKETVRELYKMGHSVSKILKAYEVQRGIELKPGTVRNWVSKIGKRQDEIQIDIFEFEKDIQKKMKETQHQS